MVTGSHQLVEPETTIVKTVTDSGKSIDTEYVSCGTKDTAHQLVIANAETCDELGDGEVGEIWVNGPSVSAGYWNDPDATNATFVRRESDCQTWLRTGDLGFMKEGSLYVTGRAKDLIILSGRNLYPQDLEAAVEESHSILQANGTCVFSVDKDSQEKLIVIAEARPGVRKLTAQQKTDCTMAVRKTLSNQHDVQFQELWLVRAGSIPRTSSGKKKRQQTRTLYESNHFQHEDIALADIGVTNPTRGIHRASQASKRLQQRLALVMVVVPILGLAAAIWLSLGTGFQTVDLAWLVGLYVATVLGVEVGFHRHFSHRSFQAVPTVRAALCIFGSMAAQGPVLFWVATHRRHHAFSDQAEYPHSPTPSSPGVWRMLRGLWHAHVGWLFKSELTNPMQYGPDIFRDPLIFRLNQTYLVWVLLNGCQEFFAGCMVKRCTGSQIIS